MPQGQEGRTTSYAADVRPLFRPGDITSMREACGLDLAGYEQVRERAEAILARLEDGDMPCDAPWPRTQIDLFRQWIADGRQP
jgi:hypothetical protein